MGKYLINKAVSYNKIFKHNLLRDPSVFASSLTNENEVESEADLTEKEVPKADGPLTASRLNYLTLYNTHYAYRVRTNCPFENNSTKIFEFFIVHGTDSKLTDFNLFTNLWRETLLLSRIQDERLQPVLEYGQLPDGIIFRQITEISGCTLEEYIQANRERIPPYTQKMNSKNAVYPGKSLPPSRPTFFTEVECIDLILKVLHLIELLHDKQIVHTNLCPEEIFLKGEDISKMCFLSLYHASWDASKVLKLP